MVENSVTERVQVLLETLDLLRVDSVDALELASQRFEVVGHAVEVGHD